MIVAKSTTQFSATEYTIERSMNLFSANMTIQGSVLRREGTLGCCLSLENRLYGMTNYHVLFGEHSPEYVQSHLVGTVEVFNLSDKGSLLVGKATHVFNPTLDYVLFEIAPDVDRSNFILLGEPIEPRIGMCVHKTGAATRLTHGVIDASSRLNESLVILGCDKIKPAEVLCDYGDSGSLWLFDDGSSRHRPVALHAGTALHDHRMGRAYSFTSIIKDILSQLSVSE